MRPERHYTSLWRWRHGVCGMTGLVRVSRNVYLLTACLKSDWRGNMSALLEPEVEGTGCRNATQRISPTQNGPSCCRSFPLSNPVVVRVRLTCVRWSMQFLVVF